MLQARARGAVARQSMGPEMERMREERAAREAARRRELAAAKLQARRRGAEARRATAKPLEEARAERAELRKRMQEAGAICIQSHLRGWAARKRSYGRGRSSG